MNQPKVYLAGPITGLNFDEATDWRHNAQLYLKSHGIQGFSPLRGKQYLKNLKELSANAADYEGFYSVLSSSRGILTRDRWDAITCDLLLVNLLGADRPSIGTIMEIAYADTQRTPIVVAMEPTDNPHEHMMLTQAFDFRVPTLEEALYICTMILSNKE